MPALLTVDQLRIATPDGKTLLDNFSMAFGRARYALVGRNGCGKTSLLRALAGISEPISGAIQRQASIGYLPQNEQVRSATVAGALGVSEALSCIDRLAAGSGTAEDVANADWGLVARVEAQLTRVGLPTDILDRPLDTLSGGERSRLSVARLWLQAPDLMLLDEPTNNLDQPGRDLVSDLVHSRDHGVVIASHDRALLEGMDAIIDLSAPGIRVFGGGWTEFVADRNARRHLAAERVSQAENNKRQAERAVQRQRERQARHDCIGRANRAKGGAPKSWLDAQKNRAERTAGKGSKVGHRLTETADENLRSAQADVEILTPLRIDLPASQVPESRMLLKFEDVIVERPERRIFGPLTFALHGSERVALVGRNGGGKSTVLKTAVGIERPSSGIVTRGMTRIAYLDQHVEILQRDATILDNMRRLNPDISDNAAYAVLARFAFRNNAASKPVSTLSGGERLRAGLACAVAGHRTVDLLILDEPTNHLDLESIEVVEAALRSFAGAILAVSHDRGFLHAIEAKREISIGSGSGF